MNIALFLNKDIEANLTYNLLRKSLKGHNIRIYYSATVGDSSKKPQDLQTIEYYEKTFFYNDLMTFLKKQKIETNFHFFDECFTDAPITLVEKSVNASSFIDEIQAFEPDLFISVRFGKIFKDKIIAIPKYGLINLHSAILPDYRGIFGTLHCIKDQKTQIGCTLHTIPNSGIDTGEIIDIANVKVNNKKSLFWHVLQLYPTGVNMIKTTLQAIENGVFPNTTKQNLDEGRYFSVPIPEDFEKIKKLNMPIISISDYYEILTTHILKNLSKADQEGLKIWLEKSMKC